MKRYAWIDKRGQLSGQESRKGKKKIRRVYRVLTKDGIYRFCHCDGKWWYPVEGGSPIRNRDVVETEDVTARDL